MKRRSYLLVQKVSQLFVAFLGSDMEQKAVENASAFTLIFPLVDFLTAYFRLGTIACFRPNAQNQRSGGLERGNNLGRFWWFGTCACYLENLTTACCLLTSCHLWYPSQPSTTHKTLIFPPAPARRPSTPPAPPAASPPSFPCHYCSGPSPQAPPP